ncbi:unnamed protein product [Peniophora sp. CBMAI 1063]|nr:unnamed protein product [Peniophora sp. CBMAI 1063]
MLSLVSPGTVVFGMIILSLPLHPTLAAPLLKPRDVHPGGVNSCSDVGVIFGSSTGSAHDHGCFTPSPSSGGIVEPRSEAARTGWPDADSTGSGDDQSDNTGNNDATREEQGHSNEKMVPSPLTGDWAWS